MSGKGISLFQDPAADRQPGNGTFQVVIFVGDLRMHTVYFLVE